MKGLIFRIVGQMKNDKRSLGLLLIAPLLIISLLFLLLGESDYRPVVALDADFPLQIESALEEQDVDMISLGEGEDSDAMLRSGEIDAVVAMEDSGISVQMLEAGGTKASKINGALKAAMDTVNPVGHMEIVYLYGDAEASLFDSLSYVFLGIISFFIVFLLSGVSFIRERTTGTLERMMLTPIKRYQVVFGYTIGFGIFAVLQSVIIVLFCLYALGIAFAGSVFLAIFIMILLAFSAVATGTFVSIFANNEFQVVQFIPVIIIPQIFFSGLIPVDTFPFHLGYLSYIMPVYYGSTALNQVIVKGYGSLEIWPYLVALFAFIAVLSLLNTVVLKKYRQI